MIMPQNWAAVPNEILIDFIRSKSGVLLLPVFILSAAISAAVALFLQCQLENICGSKGRRKSDSARAGQRICDNIFERSFAARAERTRSATCRAHSIESFNKKLGSNSPFTLRWGWASGPTHRTNAVDHDGRALKDLLHRSAIRFQK